MNGLTASGKSWLSVRLARAVNGVHLHCTAEIKREMGFVSREEASPADIFRKGSKIREAVYAEILKRLARSVSTNHVTILDGAYETFEKRSAVYRLCESSAVNVVCLFCHCSRPEAIRRIKGRDPAVRATDEAVDVHVVYHIEDAFEYPLNDSSRTSANLTVIDSNTEKLVAQAKTREEAAKGEAEVVDLLKSVGYDFGTKRPRIGLDFDGLIADTTKAKKAYAGKEYGILLNPEDCDRETGIRLLGKDRYFRMIRDIYGSKTTLALDPVPGAIDALGRLEQVADVYIVTARYSEQVSWLRKWMEERILPVHGVVHTAEQSKRDTIRSLQLDWFFDDSLRNLVDAKDTDARLVLYDPYGRRPRGSPHNEIALSSWAEFMDLVMAEML